MFLNWWMNKQNVVHQKKKKKKNLKTTSIWNTVHADITPKSCSESTYLPGGLWGQETSQLPRRSGFAHLLATYVMQPLGSSPPRILGCPSIPILQFMSDKYGWRPRKAKLWGACPSLTTQRTAEEATPSRLECGSVLSATSELLRYSKVKEEDEKCGVKGEPERPYSKLKRGS